MPRDRAAALTADDLDWEDLPTQYRSGIAEDHCRQIGEMRAALHARRGKWAVLDTFDKPTAASVRANALNKRKADDARLTGIEITGRKILDGGSKLYVRVAP